MKEIKLTQGKVAIVDDEDFEYLDQWKWYAKKNPRSDTYYAARSISFYVDGKRKQGTKYMHKEILDAPRGMEVDHENHNGLDNQKSNIRICTQSQNQRNRLKYKNNTRGYKGVSSLRKYIVAQIFVDGKNKWLGYFKTPELAAKAYNKAAIKYFGEFAQLNEI